MGSHRKSNPTYIASPSRGSCYQYWDYFVLLMYNIDHLQKLRRTEVAGSLERSGDIEDILADRLLSQDSRQSKNECLTLV